MRSVILGAKGMVGQQLALALPDAVTFDRESLDVTNFEDLKNKLSQAKPEVVFNCVAFNDVDGAEKNIEQAFLMNAELVKELAEIANALDATLVHFSTGYVFDGSGGSYSEDAEPKAISIYAESKLAGERNARLAAKHYLVRTNVVFGPPGQSTNSKKSFVDIMLSLAEKSELKVVNDETNSITYAPDLAKSVVELVNSGAGFGVYHIVNEGSATWYEFAREIFRQKGVAIKLIPVPGTEFPRPAKRPARAVINNTKLPKLRPWQEALKEYLTN